VPLTLDLGVDGSVLLFTFGVSTLAGLFFGLAPALQSTNPDVAPTLKDDRSTTRHRRLGLRNLLVAFQMALSVVLLVGGGLFVRSLGVAGNADLGFSTRDAGVVWVDLSISGVPSAEQPALREELTLRARALPGIEAATSASHIPFLFGASGGYYDIPGADPPADWAGHNVQRAEVDPAFFETMGIPLVTGRAFMEEDRPGSPRVAIVNETAARWYWPGESPVGREIFPLGSEQGFRVVGVAGDTKINRLREPAKPLFYFPIAQMRDQDLILVARGRPAPEQITGMLRGMIREVNPNLMIMDAKTMEENIGVVLFPARMAALLLGVFGLLALTLATIGLYGVVSFAVSQRTQEMGIRLSLGADAGAVMGMVMRGAMGLVGIGGIVGLAAAIVLAQLIRSVLFGVGPWDATTLLGVPILLGIVAAMAALIPARRASRVDPVEALKYE
jgi:predicted permease